MSIRERPRLDRARLQREELMRRHLQALVKQALGLLRPGEGLGTPRRDGAHVVLPIVPLAEMNPVDEEAVSALLAAWLDEPVA